MILLPIFLIFTIINQVFSTGIPIWELLTYEEKVGSLTFIFLRQVHLYCKKSNIPDCEKVLSLYGISNLLKIDEKTLDLIDPNHRDAKSDLWSKVMSGSFALPLEEEVGPGNLPRISQPGNFQKPGNLQRNSQAANSLRNSQTEWERDFNLLSNIESDYYSPTEDYDIHFEERFPHAVRVSAPPHFRAPSMVGPRSHIPSNGDPQFHAPSIKEPRSRLPSNEEPQFRVSSIKEHQFSVSGIEEPHFRAHSMVGPRSHVTSTEDPQFRAPSIKEPHYHAPSNEEANLTKPNGIASEDSHSKAGIVQLQEKSNNQNTFLFDTGNSRISEPKREVHSKTIYSQLSNDKREPILLLLRK